MQVHWCSKLKEITYYVEFSKRTQRNIKLRLRNKDENLVYRIRNRICT